VLLLRQVLGLTFTVFLLPMSAASVDAAFTSDVATVNSSSTVPSPLERLSVEKLHQHTISKHLLFHFLFHFFSIQVSRMYASDLIANMVGVMASDGTLAIFSERFLGTSQMRRSTYID